MASRDERRKKWIDERVQKAGGTVSRGYVEEEAARLDVLGTFDDPQPGEDDEQEGLLMGGMSRTSPPVEYAGAQRGEYLWTKDQLRRAARESMDQSYPELSEKEKDEYAAEAADKYDTIPIGERRSEPDDIVSTVKTVLEGRGVRLGGTGGARESINAAKKEMLGKLEDGGWAALPGAAYDALRGQPVPAPEADDHWLRRGLQKGVKIPSLGGITPEVTVSLPKDYVPVDGLGDLFDRTDALGLGFPALARGLDAAGAIADVSGIRKDRSAPSTYLQARVGDEDMSLPVPSWAVDIAAWADPYVPRPRSAEDADVAWQKYVAANPAAGPEEGAFKAAVRAGLVGPAGPATAHNVGRGTAGLAYMADRGLVRAGLSTAGEAAYQTTPAVLLAKSLAGLGIINPAVAEDLDSYKRKIDAVATKAQFNEPFDALIPSAMAVEQAEGDARQTAETELIANIQALSNTQVRAEARKARRIPLDEARAHADDADAGEEFKAILAAPDVQARHQLDNLPFSAMPEAFRAVVQPTVDDVVRVSKETQTRYELTGEAAADRLLGSVMGQLQRTELDDNGMPVKVMSTAGKVAQATALLPPLLTEPTFSVRDTLDTVGVDAIGAIRSAVTHGERLAGTLGIPLGDDNAIRSLGAAAEIAANLPAPTVAGLDYYFASDNDLWLASVLPGVVNYKSAWRTPGSSATARILAAAYSGDTALTGYAEIIAGLGYENTWVYSAAKALGLAAEFLIPFEEMAGGALLAGGRVGMRGASAAKAGVNTATGATGARAAGNAASVAMPSAAGHSDSVAAINSVVKANAKGADAEGRNILRLPPKNVRETIRDVLDVVNLDYDKLDNALEARAQRIRSAVVGRTVDELQNGGPDVEAIRANPAYQEHVEKARAWTDEQAAKVGQKKADAALSRYVASVEADALLWAMKSGRPATEFFEGLDLVRIADPEVGRPSRAAFYQGGEPVHGAVAKVIEEERAGTVRVGEQSVEERTSATDWAPFKGWFGKSQVLDTERKPLVVYHGTTSDVTAFDRIDGGNMWGRGYYFAESAEDASNYATGFHNRVTPKGDAAPNVMPVYLKMERPFVMDATVDRKTLRAVERAAGEKLGDYVDAGSQNRDLRQALYEQVTGNWEKANDILRRAGFDGLVERSGTATTTGGRTFMVFEPEQIKSASGNRGTFDPKDADVRHEGADAGFDWSGARGRYTGDIPKNPADPGYGVSYAWLAPDGEMVYLKEGAEHDDAARDLLKQHYGEDSNYSAIGYGADSERLEEMGWRKVSNAGDFDAGKATAAQRETLAKMVASAIVHGEYQPTKTITVIERAGGKRATQRVTAYEFLERHADRRLVDEVAGFLLDNGIFERTTDGKYAATRKPRKTPAKRGTAEDFKKLADGARKMPIAHLVEEAFNVAQNEEWIRDVLQGVLDQRIIAELDKRIASGGMGKSTEMARAGEVLRELAAVAKSKEEMVPILRAQQHLRDMAVKYIMLQTPARAFDAPPGGLMGGLKWGKGQITEQLDKMLSGGFIVSETRALAGALLDAIPDKALGRTRFESPRTAISGSGDLGKTMRADEAALAAADTADNIVATIQMYFERGTRRRFDAGAPAIADPTVPAGLAGDLDEAVPPMSLDGAMAEAADMAERGRLYNSDGVIALARAVADGRIEPRTIGLTLFDQMGIPATRVNNIVNEVVQVAVAGMQPLGAIFTTFHEIAHALHYTVLGKLEHEVIGRAYQRAVDEGLIKETSYVRSYEPSSAASLAEFFADNFAEYVVFHKLPAVLGDELKPIFDKVLSGLRKFWETLKRVEPRRVEDFDPEMVALFERIFDGSYKPIETADDAARRTAINDAFLPYWVEEMTETVWVEEPAPRRVSVALTGARDSFPDVINAMRDLKASGEELAAARARYGATPTAAQARVLERLQGAVASAQERYYGRMRPDLERALEGMPEDLVRRVVSEDSIGGWEAYPGEPGMFLAFDVMGEEGLKVLKGRLSRFSEAFEQGGQLIVAEGDVVALPKGTGIFDVTRPITPEERALLVHDDGGERVATMLVTVGDGKPLPTELLDGIYATMNDMGLGWTMAHERGTLILTHTPEWMGDGSPEFFLERVRTVAQRIGRWAENNGQKVDVRFRRDNIIVGGRAADSNHGFNIHDYATAILDGDAAEGSRAGGVRPAPLQEPRPDGGGSGEAALAGDHPDPGAGGLPEGGVGDAPRDGADPAGAPSDSARVAALVGDLGWHLDKVGGVPHRATVDSMRALVEGIAPAMVSELERMGVLAPASPLKTHRVEVTVGVAGKERQMTLRPVRLEGPPGTLKVQEALVPGGLDSDARFSYADMDYLSRRSVLTSPLGMAAGGGWKPPALPRAAMEPAQAKTLEAFLADPSRRDLLAAQWPKPVKDKMKADGLRPLPKSVRTALGKMADHRDALLAVGLPDDLATALALPVQTDMTRAQRSAAAMAVAKAYRDSVVLPLYRRHQNSLGITTTRPALPKKGKAGYAVTDEYKVQLHRYALDVLGAQLTTLLSNGTNIVQNQLLAMVVRPRGRDGLARLASVARRAMEQKRAALGPKAKLNRAEGAAILGYAVSALTDAERTELQKMPGNTNTLLRREDVGTRGYTSYGGESPVPVELDIEGLLDLNDAEVQRALDKAEGSVAEAEAELGSLHAEHAELKARASHGRLLAPERKALAEMPESIAEAEAALAKAESLVWQLRGGELVPVTQLPRLKHGVTYVSKADLHNMLQFIIDFDDDLRRVEEGKQGYLIFEKTPDEDDFSYMARVQSMVSGSGSKIASFTALLLHPAKAVVGAIDRHMIRQMGWQLWDTKEDFEAARRQWYNLWKDGRGSEDNAFNLLAPSKRKAIAEIKDEGERAKALAEALDEANAEDVAKAPDEALDEAAPVEDAVADDTVVDLEDAEEPEAPKKVKEALASAMLVVREHLRARRRNVSYDDYVKNFNGDWISQVQDLLAPRDMRVAPRGMDINPAARAAEAKALRAKLKGETDPAVVADLTAKLDTVERLQQMQTWYLAWRAKWGDHPLLLETLGEDISVMSPFYAKAMDLLASHEVAKKGGFKGGMTQWILWDEQRGYYEPELALYPGLSTVPVPLTEALSALRGKLSQAGLTNPKLPVRPATRPYDEHLGGQPMALYHTRAGEPGPRGAFEFDPKSQRFLIYLFDTADFETLFHEKSHLLLALLGEEWHDMLVRYFDHEELADGSVALTREGTEQATEALRIWYRTRQAPDGALRAGFEKLTETLTYYWKTLRARMGSPAGNSLGLPPGMAALWDARLRPDGMVKPRMVNAAAQGRRGFPTVRVAASPQERIAEGKTRRAGAAREAGRVDLRRDSVMQALGLKEGQVEVDAVDVAARALAYVVTERYRKLYRGEDLAQLTARSIVPASRVSKITEEVRERLANAFGVPPEKLTVEGQALVLDEAQQAGFRILLDELAGEPMGNLVPRELLHPSTKLAKVPVELYNRVQEALTDVHAGAGSRRVRYADEGPATLGYVLWRAISGTARDVGKVSDEVHGMQSRLTRAFKVEEVGEGYIAPDVRQLIDSRIRELGQVHEWVMSHVRRVKSQNPGVTIGEMVKGLRTVLSPPVAVTHARALVDLESRFRNDVTSGVPTIQDMSRSLRRAAAVLTWKGMASPHELAALRFLTAYAELRKTDLRAALVMLGNDSVAIGDALRVVHDGLKQRLAVMESRAVDIMRAVAGAEDANVAINRTTREKLGVYTAFYNGDWEHLFDWATTARGLETGMEADRISRMDPGTAMLGLVARLRAHEVVSELAYDLASYGIRGATRELTDKLPLVGVEHQMYVERVAFYLNNMISWDTMRSVDPEGNKVHTPNAPPGSIYPPRERVYESYRDDAGGLHDVEAYTDASRILESWGFKYGKGEWVNYQLGDGTTVLLPAMVIDAIEESVDRVGNVGQAWNSAQPQKLHRDLGLMLGIRQEEGWKNKAIRAAGEAVNSLLKFSGFTFRMLNTGLTTGLVVPNPAYYVGNAAGAVMQMQMRLGPVKGTIAAFRHPALAGAVAGRLWRNGGFHPSVAPLITREGRIYTAELLTDLANRHGLKGSFLHAETAKSLARDLRDTMAPRWRKMMRTPQFWQETLTEAATASDNYFRMATFINALEDGLDPAAAAAVAREAIFDYSRLTDFEKGALRPVIMFYSFFRQNQNLFWDTLLTHPSRVLGAVRLQRGLWANYSEDDPELVKHPAYNERYAIAFRDAVRNQHATSQVVTMTPPSPVLQALGFYVDIFDAIQGDKEATRQLASMANPMLQAPFVLATGTEVFSGRELGTSNPVPPWFVEIDRALTGGMFYRDLFDARYEYERDPARSDIAGGYRYNARNGVTWWLFRNLVQVPPFGRGMDTITMMDRANIGPVEAAVWAARTANPADAPMGTGDTAGPRENLTFSDETRNLFGIKTVPIPTAEAAEDMLLRRHMSGMKEELRTEYGKTEVYNPKR